MKHGPAILLVLLVLLVLSGIFNWARAADTKISALPAAGAITGVEQFPCVQGGVTDKCTVTQAVTFTYSLLSGDCTATAGGAATCTKTNGVAFSALATAASVNLATQVGATILPVANGGNGTASPGLTAGTGITLGSTWPTQSVTLTIPVAISSGGTGQTTASTAFNALSPMTTVGDIIYGGASGVGTRLANGTSGQFLGANTGAAPSWQTPAAGSANLSTYNTNRYYTFGGTQSITGIAAVANVITCTKGIIYQKLTFQVLTLNITTGGSSNVQSALYADTNGLPGVLLSSTPSVADTGTLGTPMTLSSNVQAGPGTIWYCVNQNDSTVIFTANNRISGLNGPFVGAQNNSTGLAALVGTLNQINGLSCTGANCNGGSSTFGTWPDLTGSTWTNVAAGSVPLMFFIPFSVP